MKEEQVALVEKIFEKMASELGELGWIVVSLPDAEKSTFRALDGGELPLRMYIDNKDNSNLLGTIGINIHEIPSDGGHYPQP